MTSEYIAQISISLRNQVSLNLVKLLVSPSEDMRKRAGALLQDEKEGLGGASKQLQKETVIAPDGPRLPPSSGANRWAYTAVTIGRWGGGEGGHRGRERPNG